MEEKPIEFPVRGIDLARAFVRQTGETTARAVNVRAFDPLEDRHRGGSRDGLARWIDDALAGEIQGIGAVAATGEEFVIGYYPFQWPDFVVNTSNFAPVRPGGSGEPQLPGLVPELSWSPGATSLYEDEAFGVTHYNPAALDPRDDTPLAGTFAFDVLIGSLFGHVATRQVIATFTPTDTATFRKGQTAFTFRRKKTPTKVAWTPPSSVDKDTVVDGSILSAVGQDKGTSALVAGTIYYDAWYFDPETGDRVALSPVDGATLGVATIYYFVALFKPTNATRYNSSRLEVTIAVTETGGSGTGPYTFRARDLWPSVFVFGHVASTVDVYDSTMVLANSVAFGAMDLDLFNSLVEGGYTEDSPAPGPVIVSVADNMELDGGGLGTWAYS
jgi:hypothetical protein